jgi:hypothetical protein
MRALLLLLCLAACDDDAAGTPDLAIIGTCPSQTMCIPGEQCTYPGFEPETCTCITPENVSCCAGGGAGANCMTAQQGGVCCGHLPPGGCFGLSGVRCDCRGNHWQCDTDDGGA